MDLFLTILGFVLVCFGIIGSLIPILPGPTLSWVGLLLLHLTEVIPNNWTFLSITLIIALITFALDYIIPAIGTKRFGGSKAGMYGTFIGLIVGILAPIPGGIIIGPFAGAFIGELANKSDSQTALKAAFGSFLGFITGTFLKFIITAVYFGFYLKLVWDYKDTLF